MGLCIEKLPHSCGSSDGLQVFQDEITKAYNGFCFVCKTTVPDPYRGGKPEKIAIEKSPEEILQALQEIDGLPTLDVPSRGLRKESLEYFDVKVAVSEEDGSTPVQCFFPYQKGNNNITGYRSRVIDPKLNWAIADMTDVDMFGWQQALASGSKVLYICEGEFDAVALYQSLRDYAKGTQWADRIPAVVSLSKGAGGTKKDFARHAAAIRGSWPEHVVLVFDQDEAGSKAVKDALSFLPYARSVALPEKDANAMVLANKSKALAQSVMFMSSSPKRTNLVWGSALHDAGRAQAEWGLAWPWNGMTQKTRGLRFGETIYIGAGVKMGKSEIVNTLAAHLITTHGLKVFLAKPEESNRKTYQLVCGKVAGRIFHDPKVEFDYDAYDKASALVGDNLCLLNLYQHLGWDSLQTDIKVAVQAGCRAVFIDPITNLTNGIASGETNTILQAIAQQLAAIAKDLDIIVFIFCHLKSPESGPPHERGGQVLSYQFSGSRAMMRSCNYMIGMEGNKDPEFDIEKRNLRKLVLLEDREFGESGNVHLYWNHKNGLFTEVEGDDD